MRRAKPENAVILRNKIKTMITKELSSILVDKIGNINEDQIIIHEKYISSSDVLILPKYSSGKLSINAEKLSSQMDEDTVINQYIPESFNSKLSKYQVDKKHLNLALFIQSSYLDQKANETRKDF